MFSRFVKKLLLLRSGNSETGGIMRDEVVLVHKKQYNQSTNLRSNVAEFEVLIF